MRHFILLGLILALPIFTGCAVTPQGPVEISSDFFQSDELSVGVVMTEMPKLNVHLPGAGCLLCIGVAEAANSDLSKHVDTLNADDLANLKEEVSEKLNMASVKNVVLETPINVRKLPKNSSKEVNAAKKSFTKLGEGQNLTHLFVIQLDAIGMQRTYANYIPTSDPKAYVGGAVYLINLSNNIYEWYVPIHNLISSTDEWKEPPSYPGLTNAYYQAIEMTKEQVFSFTGK